MPRDVIVEESQLVRDLLAMQERMKDPGRWCKGSMYITVLGQTTEDPQTAHAACFSGHAHLVVNEGYTRRVSVESTVRIAEVFKAFCEANPYECNRDGAPATPIPFNDYPTTTHDMMMAAMARAVAWARSH